MSRDDAHYQLMRLIAEQPELSQRGLAKALGISLGKANYCLRALVDRGWVKANNFRRSRNKLGYVYLLTPEGLEQKARLAQRFLNSKIEEYEQLRAEIRQLRKDIQKIAD